MGWKIEGISFYRESQEKGSKEGKNRFLLYSLCHVFLDLLILNANMVLLIPFSIMIYSK